MAGEGGRTANKHGAIWKKGELGRHDRNKACGENGEGANNRRASGGKSAGVWQITRAARHSTFGISKRQALSAAGGRTAVAQRGNGARIRRACGRAEEYQEK